MCPQTEIAQNAGLGSHGNTFIGEQHNHQGLSITDATQMAFSIFREYYPQLRQEALAELEVLVQENLSKMPPENIVSPRAKTAIPLLQSASITEETDLRKMYAKILANDMNKEQRPKVHPAYAKIVDQMSVDDALLFKRIVEIANSIPVARITFTFGTQYLISVLPRYFSPYFDDLDPWKVSISIENLSRLNIIDFFEGTVSTYDYDLIKNHSYIQNRFAFAKEHNQEKNLQIEMSKRVIQINDFGKGLSKVCF